MTFFDDNGEVLPAIDFMNANTISPVNVTFRFHGATRKARPDRSICGAISSAIRTSRPSRCRARGGALVYKTTIMPGTYHPLSVLWRQGDDRSRCSPAAS